MSLTSAAKAKKITKRLEDIFSQELATQKKINRLVKNIAQDISADVCSLYINCNNEYLELFASYGLRYS